MQKREIIFVYLPNTSRFMHFQSVRQKKGIIHYKTNKYRWHFRSKPHQTTLLRQLVNQESFLRMGIDAQVQDLRKTVTETLKELRQNGQLLNAPSEETTTMVQILEKDADTRIKDVNSSVQINQGSITAVKNGQTGIMQTLMALEKAFAKLKETYQTQGKCTFNHMDS